MDSAPTVISAVEVKFQVPSTADRFLENTFCPDTAAVKLTIREREILALILQGKTNKEIAFSLGRVERTVEFHRNRLMQKLDAHNSTELAKKALMYHLA